MNSEAQKPQRKLWLDILIEVGILVALYFVNLISRGSIGAKESTALQNARTIIDAERALGIYVELDIQSLFLKSYFLTHLANILYTICYYPTILVFLIWAYWRHRPKYKFIRTVVVISAILASISFALYPTAPPRFFDGGGAAEDLGFIDTIAVYWNVNESTDQAFYNPYAAMPSLHFAWTVLIGIAVVWMTRSRFGRTLAVLLPIGMFVGITATANHFILDAVASVILIGLAFGLATFLPNQINR